MKSSKEWISISDMMTGLMMVFLFISILYISQVRDLTKEYEKNKNSIYKSLQEEFEKDLKIWNAELIKDSLTLRFLSPSIMFDPYKSNIKPKFKKILLNFCPRYFRILHQFKKQIEEIRIEGHTSHEWGGVSKNEAYYKNMELSQGRTRSVLRFCSEMKSLDLKTKKWAKQRLTANGLSSSKPLCLKDTYRCRGINRRVEFRIQVNKDDILNKISSGRVF